MITALIPKLNTVMKIFQRTHIANKSKTSWLTAPAIRMRGQTKQAPASAIAYRANSERNKCLSKVGCLSDDHTGNARKVARKPGGIMLTMPYTSKGRRTTPMSSAGFCIKTANQYPPRPTITPKSPRATPAQKLSPSEETGCCGISFWVLMILMRSEFDGCDA